VTQLALPTAPPPAPALTDGPPTADAQQRRLVELRQTVAPLLREMGLPKDFTLQPGLRLRSKFGHCTFRPGQAPAIVIRCANQGGAWRARGAIVVTLLHELAHLKHKGHGPRFWQFHRRLLERAAAMGLYDAADDDAGEAAAGNTKLAGSAAGERAEVAQARRRERYQARRAETVTWQPGETARVDAPRSTLHGAVVRIVKVARTRVIAALADGREFSIPGSLLMRMGPGEAAAAPAVVPPATRLRERWKPGDRALVARGRLAGVTVSVQRVGRTRVVAATNDGQVYSIPAALLAPLES